MNRTVGILLALFLVSLGSGAETARKDKISILAISPNPPLKRGVPIELTVDVEADLESTDAGTAEIGFNTDSPASFRMVDSRKLQAGAQRFTFVVKVVPVDWGESGDFMVMVNMGAVATGTSWRPTAAARRPLATEP
jgi:hypothetical protein